MNNPFYAYVFATTALALLMYLGRHERHQVEGEVEIFRYRSLIAWSALIGPLLMGFAGYLILYPLNPKPIEKLNFTDEAIFAFIGFLAILGLWIKTLCIKVDQQTLHVSSCFGHRATPFRDLRKIIVKKGARWDVLNVFNTKGKRVLYVSSSLQEFDDLVYLLKERTAKYHAEFKSRDAWGNWSDG